MGLDDVGHLDAATWVLEVGNGVHPGILEELPNNILEADQVITGLGLCTLFALNSENPFI